MGDGGRRTKDRGLRCDQRALPFPCILCISWFKSLRPLRSLRLDIHKGSELIDILPFLLSGDDQYFLPRFFRAIGGKACSHETSQHDF